MIDLYKEELGNSIVLETNSKVKNKILLLTIFILCTFNLTDSLLKKDVDL
jgi:hypothetical protein